MPLVIDAHQHFWQLDRFQYDWLNAPQLAKIRRDYLPADLQPLLATAGVQKSIFVQTQHNVAENRWVLELADQHDFIAGIVGWVDLASPACEEQLLEFKAHPKFLGVRHVTHDEPDDDFIVREEVLRGLQVLEKHQVPFDLLFYPKHLRHVPTIVRRCPNLPLVINHLAKPDIRSQSMDGWRDDFQRASRFPQVHCKLSGMVTEANWETWHSSDLIPYVQQALESFGPERCMFGSDWPVCELAGSYSRVYHGLLEALGPLSEHERNAILGDTAARFYGLPS
ncbi:MAG TPA: amidohydrolase family protein [Pirellulaceae bacterium]|nr:amidohydrolase family protein [Pirellulaceae bacterium]